jgi:hypothetical protein
MQYEDITKEVLVAALNKFKLSAFPRKADPTRITVHILSNPDDGEKLGSKTRVKQFVNRQKVGDIWEWTLGANLEPQTDKDEE